MVSAFEVEAALDSIGGDWVNCAYTRIDVGMNEVFYISPSSGRENGLFLKFRTHTPADDFRAGAVVSGYVDDTTPVPVSKIVHTDWSRQYVPHDWYAAAEATGVTGLALLPSR